MPGYRGVNDAITEGYQYLLKSHENCSITSIMENIIKGNIVKVKVLANKLRIYLARPELGGCSEEL